jgi:Cof subfamily protein (haloacid dehalogenase superfamily)
LPLLLLEHSLWQVNTLQWDVLVLDLDGTLLCSQGEVSEQNIHAFNIVRELGVEIVIATGRSISECKHILDAIHHRGVCISAGGSQLTSAEGKTIARGVVDATIVQEVTEKMIASGHRSLLLKDATACDVQYVLVGDAALHEASKWWFDTHDVSVQEVCSVEEDPWPDDTLRVGAIADEKELLPIAQQLERSLEGRAKLQHWSAVTCSEATGSSTHLLEVFGYEVNKWSMLKRHLGESIQSERIAAIGDGLNDVEVLREAGISIVMENANEHVQQYADVLAGHHNKHGFAGAMHRWIIPGNSKP